MTTSPLVVPSSSRRLHVADRLNREWSRLRSDPTCLGRARSWGLVPGRLADLDEVLAAAGYGRAADDDEGDRCLARLVARAGDDELAARVVLQRILPGLICIALRRGRIVPGGASVAFDELAAAAWEVIRRYPIDRRPCRVAANVLRDVEYRAFVRPARRRSLEVFVGDVEGALDEECGVEDDLDPGARFEWAQLADWARRRGVDPAHLDLLGRVVAGRAPAEIASSLRCTERTVRNRRRAAVAEVRRAYADVAA